MNERELTADFGAVLDANVLANLPVCDLLLRLAETPRLYIPFFSEELITEAERTHRKLNWPENLVQSFSSALRAHFPESLVTYPPALPQTFTNDPKDRHVLAAAVASKSEVIVTFNLKHFRAKDLAPWGVEAQHPQDFLLSLYDLKGPRVFVCLSEMAIKRRKDLAQVLGALKKYIPTFAEQVAADLSLLL